jgi:hypothetical protein
VKQILQLVHEIIISFWPQFLAVCIIGGLLALILLLALLRRCRSGSQSPAVTHQPSTGIHPHRATDIELRPDMHAKSVPSTGIHGNRAIDSLARLNTEYYQIFHEVFIPRLSGKGTTRLHHIVLSTHGIFVIQVQSESGLISGDVKHTHWARTNDQDAQVLTNPISRNAYHVKALAEFLDLPEILFFSVIHYDNPATFQTPQPPHVLTSGLGRHIISHQAKLISPDLLANVTDRLLTHQASYTFTDASQAYAQARAPACGKPKTPPMLETWLA